MDPAFSILLLSISVFIAGFIDAIAGGGGLITFPAYMNYGLRTELLLGTNKLSSFFGTLIAVVKFFSEIRFSGKKLLLIFFFSTAGSLMGAIFISFISTYYLKYFLISALPAISIFMLFRRDFGISDFSFSLSQSQMRIRVSLISFFISFYDGMLGPGTGTLFAFSYSKFCGHDLLTSTAMAKFSNLVSNLAALITFLSLGKVDIKLGIAMALVSASGNFLGSKAALKNGAVFIKPILFIVSNALLGKIIYDMVK